MAWTVRQMTRILWGCWLCLWAVSVSYAQSFLDTTRSDINDSTLCPGAPGIGGNTPANVTRTFNVTGVGTVDVMKLGLLAQHTWRGDMRVTLTSPSGTSRVLITEDTSGTGNDDNYNIELFDAAPQTVNTGDQNGTNSLAASPYEFPVSPNNSFAVFTGQNANGTWTLDICDDYAGQNGELYQAELIFVSSGEADLELTASSNDFGPIYGDNVTLTFTVSNDGPEDVTGVQVSVPLPSGLTHTANSGGYNTGTGIWTIPGTLGVGTDATLTINATVETTGSYSIDAQITASSEPDPDSTVNDGINGDDDDLTLALFPTATLTPPALVCPVVDQFVLDWEAAGATYGWDAGDLTNSYTVAGEPVVLTLSGDTGFLGQIGGTDSPVTQTQYNGGFTGQHSVGIAANFDAQSQSVTMTMNLGTAGRGVDAVQFRIFDVDLGGWVDRLTVTGSLNGNAATPILTNSTRNYVSGNQAIGQIGNATEASAAGTVTVTFNTPVDTVAFVYDNHPSVGPDPAFQIISLHNITMCPREMPDLSATKTVEVYDPGGLGLYMTPGNEIVYTITVTNSAAADIDADDVDIADVLPSNVKFVSASVSGGFTAGSLTTVPATNTDCAVTSCNIAFEDGILPINSSGEIAIRALIK